MRVGQLEAESGGQFRRIFQTHKVSAHTIYTWRRKFGEMDPNQVSVLKRITVFAYLPP